jgi:hypothetical protein
MGHSLPISQLVKSIATLLLITVSGFPQDRQLKVIEWSKSPINSKTRTAANLLSSDQIEGLEIEDISVEGRPVAIGQGFAAGDDWLETITFRVKNISGQRLKAVQMMIVLPEISHDGPDIVYCYGCLKAEREKGIAPGEEVELKIPGGSYYRWVKDKVLAQGSMSGISVAQIRHMIVTLPDGAKWISGCVKTGAPENACPHAAP